MGLVLTITSLEMVKFETAGQKSAFGVDQDANGSVPQIFILILWVALWILLYLILFLPNDQESQEQRDIEDARNYQKEVAKLNSKSAA